MDRDNIRREKQRQNYELTSIPVMQSILASYHKINEVEDDYDACQRRFSSRLMSTSSSGTTGDDLAGDDRWQISDIDGSPEKTIYSSRDGIPSQVFPSGEFSNWLFCYKRHLEIINSKTYLSTSKCGFKVYCKLQ